VTAVVLGKADLALFSDPAGHRVSIPHLTAVTPTQSYAGTTVLFAGDTYPTPFRGPGRSKTWPLTARYARTEQDQLLALLDLIELAAASADSRLLLRTHYGQVAGLDDATAVVIFDVQPQPQIGLYVDVQFTAQAVQFTLEV
jgi:hypothetical protein